MKAHRIGYALILWMAATAWASAAVGASTGEKAVEDVAKPAAKSETVDSVMWKETEWFDAARGRPVPVRIYYPIAGKGPFPIILFSHGLGRSREDCAYLGIHWARLGYVSVYVEHSGSDEAVWRGTIQPKKHLKEAYENPATMRNRPLDLRFALDRLEQLKGEGDSLAVRLDFSRVGAAGYDLGAQTALALAGQMLPGELIEADSRVRAVVAMSPPVPLGRVSLDTAYQAIHVPCLYITGTEDNGIVGETKAYQRRIPFDRVNGADQYLATFFGGDHMIYAGHMRAREGGKRDTSLQPFIREASTLFWEAYLGEKPQAIAALRGTGLNAVLGSTASVEKKLVAVEKKLAADKLAN